jgi:CBASS immunity sensor of nucleotide second messenger signals/CHAT domain-containing protein
MSNKIRILLLAADPRNANYRPLLSQEVRRIKKEIEFSRHQDLFEIYEEFGITRQDLQGALIRCEPNIVHFSGHGNRQSELLFEDESGNANTVTAEAFAELIQILKDNIWLVVLNACHTKSVVEAFKEAIDFTIGMNDAVEDLSAIAFSSAFYRGLGFGYPVKTAFDLAINQIKLEELSGPKIPELFTRPGADAAKPFIESNSHSALGQGEQRVIEPPPPCLWIHGWVRRVYDFLPAVELDWTRYFDRASRTAPSQEAWEESLLTSLQQAKERLREYGDFIDVRGRLSLTIMLGVGFVFPRVDGYKLRAEQPTLGKTTLWRSDAEPSKRRFQIIEEKQRRIGERAENILVVLSITGNAIREAASLYKQNDEIGALILTEPDTGTGEDAIESDSDAVALAISAKKLIRELKIKYEASRIHLVLYTPASYSLFLGQYINALGDIVTYERDVDGNYKQSITLRTG